MSTVYGNPLLFGRGIGKKLEFTYTGDYTEREDGVIEFRSSGTFVPARDYVIDTFHVGGGAGGATNSLAAGAGGGGSGYTKTQRKVTIKKGQQYILTIGQGGSGGAKGTTSTGSDGGTTSGFINSSGAIISAKGGKAPSVWYTGGNGGSGGGSGSNPNASTAGGAGGTNGGDGQNAYPHQSYGGTGQGTNTYEFGEVSTSPSKLYAGGGGGGNYYTYTSAVASGGARGGGNGNGDNGKANTGGGGGGGKGNTSGNGTAGGTGGSGIICIRLTPSA